MQKLHNTKFSFCFPRFPKSGIYESLQEMSVGPHSAPFPGSSDSYPFLWLFADCDEQRSPVLRHQTWRLEAGEESWSAPSQMLPPSGRQCSVRRPNVGLRRGVRKPIGNTVSPLQVLPSWFRQKMWSWGK